MSRLDDLHALRFFVLRITGGQPGRTTEDRLIQKRNTAQSRRSFYVIGGLASLAPEYNKADSQMTASRRIILRVPDQETSAVVLIDVGLLSASYHFLAGLLLNRGKDPGVPRIQVDKHLLYLR